MIYTEEMKRKINAAGLHVIEFKLYVKKFNETMETLNDDVKKIAELLAKIISESAQKLRESFGYLISLKQDLVKIPTKQRYKFVRKIGSENYHGFFLRKQIHRARSCC